MDKVPMTAEGYAALEAEIQVSQERRAPAHHQADRRRADPWRSVENAEYHAAKEQQGITEARMANLEDKLSRADIIDVSKLKGDQVMFGATVTLVDEDTDDKAKYRIVGEIEANVKEGRISITSPLARALLGNSGPRHGVWVDGGRDGRERISKGRQRIVHGVRRSRMGCCYCARWEGTSRWRQRRRGVRWLQRCRPPQRSTWRSMTRSFSTTPTGLSSA